MGRVKKLAAHMNISSSGASNTPDGTLLRFALSLTLLLPLAAAAQNTQLPEAPAPTAETLLALAAEPAFSTSATPSPYSYSLYPAGYEPQESAEQAAKQSDKPRLDPTVQLDRDGKPVPIDRQQPKRILGLMPNFRTVSGGVKPPPPTYKSNLIIAYHQSLDYSTFIFLGLTSITAEGMNSHPALGKGVNGLWNYSWRGFIDKTDGTFLSAFLLASVLHEDTRYYALGNQHSIPMRALYIVSRQAVARTYSGASTPNIAGLGGKVLTQYISRFYYPSGSSDFSVLATKFGYSVMRDVAFSTVREFYPDIAGHYIKKHRAAALRQSQKDAADAVKP